MESKRLASCGSWWRISSLPTKMDSRCIHRRWTATQTWEDGGADRMGRLWMHRQGPVAGRTRAWQGLRPRQAKARVTIPQALRPRQQQEICSWAAHLNGLADHAEPLLPRVDLLGKRPHVLGRDHGLRPDTGSRVTRFHAAGCPAGGAIRCYPHSPTTHTFATARYRPGRLTCRLRPMSSSRSVTSSTPLSTQPRSRPFCRWKGDTPHPLPHVRGRKPPPYGSTRRPRHAS